MRLTIPTQEARALKVIDWLVSATIDRHDVFTRQPFDGEFVQRHVPHGCAHDRTPYSMRVAIIIRVGPDGLITRVDEYVDRAALDPLQKQEPSRR